MGTSGLQAWILENVVPLLVLVVAVVLFMLANKGDNAKSMKVVAGVLIALAVLGLSVGGNAQNIGASIWGLFT